MIKKKFRSHIFELSLTESTEEEVAKYERLFSEWQKTLPEKMLMLDDTVLTNLFYAEKWDKIKKECPIAYKIYNENVSFLINGIAKRMKEIDINEERKNKRQRSDT